MIRSTGNPGLEQLRPGNGLDPFNQFRVGLRLPHHLRQSPEPQGMSTTGERVFLSGRVESDIAPDSESGRRMTNNALVLDDTTDCNFEPESGLVNPRRVNHGRFLIPFRPDGWQYLVPKILGQFVVVTRDKSGSRELAGGA